MSIIKKLCRGCHGFFPATDEFFRRTGVSRVLSNKCRNCTRRLNRSHGRSTRQINRILVLRAYGGDNPKCECCSESHDEFLSIDHIDGGGRKHRKEIANHTYEWLITNQFPPGFRILCHNCNFSLGKYGYCPHKRGT